MLRPGAVLEGEVPIEVPIDVPATKIVWECETDTGWSEYGADIAAQLESAFGARAAVSWNTHGFSYSVDWDRMQQVNEKTGRRRGIRRSVELRAVDGEDDAGDEPVTWCGRC